MFCGKNFAAEPLRTVDGPPSMSTAKAPWLPDVAPYISIEFPWNEISALAPACLVRLHMENNVRSSSEMIRWSQGKNILHCVIVVAGREWIWATGPMSGVTDAWIAVIQDSYMGLGTRVPRCQNNGFIVVC